MERKEEKKEGKRAKKLPRFVNLHLIFLCTIVLFFGLIIWKFYHWGRVIDRNELNQELAPITAETLDYITPPPAKTDDYVDDGITTIAFFGNNPFADDRNSPDNLVNLIKEKTGAKVYNLSLKDTYLACANPEFDPENYPLDAYSFYWLTELLTSGSNKNFYPAAAEAMEAHGETAPEYCREVIELITTIDFSTVDIAVILYDASDYFIGRAMYNDADPYENTTFCGSLASGITKLQEKYPNMQIIVMSPPYAYYRLEDGHYVSSNIFSHTELVGRDVLSTYCIKEGEYAIRLNTSFIDNLYGSITDENATQYLSDHYHLNVEGRKVIADRLYAALHYYDDVDVKY